jgi:hypothetical protein
LTFNPDTTSGGSHQQNQRAGGINTSTHPNADRKNIKHQFQDQLTAS